MRERFFYHRPFLAASIVSVLLLFFCGGWGRTAHSLINRVAPNNLPPAMAGFAAVSSLLADSASNADTRKSKDPTESPKHFIDIDDYPEFAAQNVSHSLDSLIQQYGSTRVYGNGILPWATVAAIDSLTVQMRRGDWNRVWSTAADLGHYVGDIHQPLHCTVNYNGQLTGNDGIHSRHESALIDRYQQLLVIRPAQASYIERPIDYVFASIYRSQTYVDSILAADTYAKTKSGWNGIGSVPASYYTALWEQAGGFTNAVIQRAVDAFANLMYTAWVDAGEPAIPIVNSVGGVTDLPVAAMLDEAYPNPFNSVTVISYQSSACSPSVERAAGSGINQSQITSGGPVSPGSSAAPGNESTDGNQRSSSVSLKVYDLLGREVAVLVDEIQAPGVHAVTFDGSRLASGMYLCRLEVRPVDVSARPYVGVKKIVLLR